MHEPRTIGIFQTYAGNDPDRWRFLVGKRLRNRDLGDGGIVGVEVDPHGGVRLIATFYSGAVSTIRILTDRMSEFEWPGFALPNDPEAIFEAEAEIAAIEEEARRKHEAATRSSSFYQDQLAESLLEQKQRAKERAQEFERLEAELQKRKKDEEEKRKRAAELRKQAEEERRREEEQEKQAEDAFKKLKCKYGVDTSRTDLDDEKLASIFSKLELEERVDDDELRWLNEYRLSKLLAIIHQRDFEWSGDPWSAVKASAFYREAHEPGAALALTRKVLDFELQWWNQRLRSAIRTTRGGALRDLGDLDSAEEVAHEAASISPSSFQPHNLLGAIYFQMGFPEQGYGHFERARELGASTHGQEHEMRQALQRASRQERADVAAYLLNRDPERFRWAARFLS